MTRFAGPLDDARSTGAYRARVGVAIVSSLVAALAAGAMIVNLHQRHTADPLHAPRLLELREQLHASPNDPALKREIRQMDYALRRQFFDSRAFGDRGVWVLVPAVVVMVTSLKLARRQRERPPVPPEGPPADASRATPAVRWAMVVFGTVTLGAAAAVVVTAPSPSQPVEPAEAPPEPIAGIWPGFRGADGDGVATFTNIPLQWNGETGDHLAWRTPIPLPGHNSAVAAAGKVFCTGATASRRAVFAFDARTGRMIWRHEVNDLSPRDADPPQVMEETGYAAPTAATDGRRVYALFANGDLVACDLEGRRLWGQALGTPDNAYGHASSLIAHHANVIVQFDQGYPDDDLSAVIAFDGQTGKQVWRDERPTAASWSSPVIVDMPAGERLIVLAEPWIAALDPATGEEIWRCEGVFGDVAVSPIFSGGRLLVVNPNDRLLAIRPGGRGDVTETHIAWQAFDGIPDIASPAADGPFVYLLQTYGTLTCIRIADGETIWSHDLGMSFESSPALVGDRLYVTSTSGVTFVLRAGEAFTQLARNDLGERVHASAAFMDGLMILRGDQRMIAIGEADP